MNRKRDLWIGLLAAAAVSLCTASSFAQSSGGKAETLLFFDPTVPETPESIVIDRAGNFYISLALTGEIRKVTPEMTSSTLAYMPIGAPCGGVFPPVAALGLALDRRDQLYVALAACDPTNNGIWKVDKDDGTFELVANAPSATVLNGLDVYRGYIYAADSFGGMIWRVPKNGGNLELWSDDPLLMPPPGAQFPGPNGIQFFRRELSVAISATGDIVAIPLLPSGAAGEARVHATLPDGQGCDEFAIDLRGRIYCTTDPFNTVVRLDRDGSSEILLTAKDGLDGPTSATFGRRRGDRRSLYITNAAFPFLTTTFTPSLMRLKVDFPGVP